MAVVGQWTLHYDWGCVGRYVQGAISFDNNGTFRGGEFETGKWTQNDCMILFQYDTVKTTYGGNIVGNTMVGMMSTFEGSNGCWYAIKVGSTIMSAEEHKPEFDASGNKAKL